MDEIRRFFMIVFAIAIAIGNSILVMMYGWGLEPKSYWWIIGMGLLGNIFSAILIELGKKGKN
jgi:hypothetical protein